ncbi:uncharacterized protein LOC143824824 [Paroedura picta]|uniref:uncharacterized protein LOC143824824 n=1 Tax=Paroedura picta TaxID=143630 RepID=UPI0040567024
MLIDAYDPSWLELSSNSKEYREGGASKGKRRQELNLISRFTNCSLLFLFEVVCGRPYANDIFTVFEDQFAEFLEGRWTLREASPPACLTVCGFGTRGGGSSPGLGHGPVTPRPVRYVRNRSGESGAGASADASAGPGPPHPDKQRGGRWSMVIPESALIVLSQRILWRPRFLLLLIMPSIHDFSNESDHMMCPKVQLSHPWVVMGKTTALTSQHFVLRLISLSLLFHIRFMPNIAFWPSVIRCLISRLQPPL